MSRASGLESFRTHLDLLDGALPGRVELRARALEHALELGLPTPREEDWRFTPLRRLAELSFEPAAPAVGTADPEVRAGDGPLQYRPRLYVPFKVAFLDEPATRAQRQALAYARQDGLTEAETIRIAGC